MELFKYGCGCVGFAPLEDGTIYMFTRCDDDDGEIKLVTRNLGEMRSKEMEPLNRVDADELANEVSSLLSDGHNMRMLRYLVK